MSNLFECEQTNAKVVSAEIGSARGKRKVRMLFEIVEGFGLELVRDKDGNKTKRLVDLKGRRATYDGKLDPENIKFTKADMIKVGWQGKDASTFVSDVMSAGKIVPINCEIVSWENPDNGKLSEWTAVRQIGGAKPLDPLANDDMREVNRWFAEAPELAPQPERNGTPAVGRSNRPANEDDLPF